MGARRYTILAATFICVAAAWAIAVACGDSPTDASGSDSSDAHDAPEADAPPFIPDDAAPSDASADGKLPLDPCPAVCANQDAGTVELAPYDGGGNIEGIAVDGCNVYWGNDEDGNIYRVPRCGGAVTAIATGQPYPIIGVALDEHSVYWTAGVDGVIRSARKDDAGGGAVVTLASANGPFAIAVDDSFVYWTETPTAPRRVWRAPLAGGAKSEVALIGSGSAFGMAIDDDHVFFDRSGQIASALKDGGMPKDLAAVDPLGSASPTCIAVDTASVYYTLFRSGAVMRVPKIGGDAGLFASAVKPRCLAMDDVSVYWVDDAPDGGLMRAAKDGGAPTAISTDPGGGAYAFLALDDTYVYWGYGGRVLRAPK